MAITIRVIVKVIRKTTQLVRLSSINQVKNGAKLGEKSTKLC